MKKHFTPFDPKEADLKKDLQAVENTFLSDSNSSRDAFENFQQRYRKASKKLHNYRRERGLDKTPSPKEKVLPKFSSHAPTPRSQKKFSRYEGEDGWTWTNRISSRSRFTWL